MLLQIISLEKTIDNLKSEKMEEENRRKSAELKASIYDREKKFYDDNFDSLLKKLSDIAHHFKLAVKEYWMRENGHDLNRRSKWQER